jgi:hypothetical protein
VWATLGFEYLISPTFTTLLHRPDFQRLLAVSRIPLFSSRIENLFINLGEVNEYHARHNSYFIQYMRDPDERLAAQEISWGTYATIRKEKEKHGERACAPDLLDPAFRNLPNLKKVEVTLATCPFPEDDERMELLCQIWNIPSTRLLPRVATTERFTNLLSALCWSPSTIRSLSHDRLPFEFFAQKSMTISLISTNFMQLTSLSLVLDYSDMPNNLHSSQAFQNLSHCVCSATDLQTFFLSFQGRRKTDISPLLASFSERSVIFSRLRDVKLEGVLCSENAVVDFLLKHKETLRKVQLGGVGSKPPHQRANGGVHLKEGTWTSALKRLQGGLDLDVGCLRVQGDMMELENGRRFDVDDLVGAEGLFVTEELLGEG